jgi:hypothetical protein
MAYFKKTFIWIIAMVAVVGLSYLDLEKTRLDEKQKDEATRLFPFTPIEVLSVTIKKDDRTIDLERWDNGWRIVAPVVTDADNEAVETFLSYVTDSRNDAEYVMDPDPTSDRLKEFGLEKPTTSVTLRVGRELTPYTLVFGDRAPTMGVAYAMLEGETAVYRVLAYARAEADKDIYYFRDKRALKINPVSIDQLSLIRGKERILLKLPDNGKWTIEKPFKATADHVRTFTMMAAFTNAEISEFIDMPEGGDKAFGLDKPMAQMMIWAEGDGEPTIRLSIGKREPEKRGYYCSVTGHDGVVVINEEAINALPFSANDLRNRELFAFDKSLIRRIDIKRASSKVSLALDVDSEWRKNGDQGEIVDFLTVKEFTDELVDTRIADFVDGGERQHQKLGLDPPVMEVRLWLEGEKNPKTLMVGYRDPSGAYMYARSAAEVVMIDRRIERVLTTYF